jgi:hypothetical protein
VTNSIIEEIHHTREEISDRFDGNIMAIANDAARRQIKANRPLWKPKTPNKTLNRTPVSPRTFGVNSRLRVGDIGSG